MRPPHGHRRRRPHPGHAGRAGRGRDVTDGAAQRRRLPGRDERQRHPVPGPGASSSPIPGSAPPIPIVTDAGLRTVTVHDQVDAVTHSLSRRRWAPAEVEGEAPEWDGGAVGRAAARRHGQPAPRARPVGRRPGRARRRRPGRARRDRQRQGPGRRQRASCSPRPTSPATVAMPRLRARGRADAGLRHRGVRGRGRRHESGAWPATGCRSRSRAAPPRSRSASRPPATRSFSGGRPPTWPRSASERRRGADRTDLPGEDRPGRRHHPARDASRTPSSRLDELALLVDTAGADEVGRVVQRRQSPDPPTYVGKGKAEELREVALAIDCDTVVFDDELTPAQQCNLEKMLGRTAIDRTAVILDIFAQNAHSQEGKAQVELAQLRYRLPRLRRRARRAVAAGRRHVGRGRRPHRHPWPGRDAARGRPPAHRAPHPQARGRPARDRPPPRDPAQGAAPGPARQRSPSSATRTPASRRCSTGSPTPACWSRTASSPPSTPPPAGSSCPAARPCCSPTPSGSSASCPTSSSRRSGRRSTVAVDADLLVHVVDAVGPRPRVARCDAVRDVLARDRRRRRARAGGVQQGRPGTRRGRAAARRPTRARWRSAPPRRGHRRAARGHDRRPAPRADDGRRAGRSPSTAATCWPPSTGRARCSSEEAGEGGMRLRGRFDDASVGRFREYVVG